MSITSEEILDIRDGLSITDRKVLSVLIDMVPSNGQYRRSSKVTHEIENRYTIDPDESYEIIVDLARDENQMYLVAGHGNFSYRPAASDYSECRSSRLLQHLFDNGFLSPDVTVPIDMPLPFILIEKRPDFIEARTEKVGESEFFIWLKK